MVTLGGGGGGLPFDGGPLAMGVALLVIVLLLWLVTRLFEV